jgi:hypothetical protein
MSFGPNQKEEKSMRESVRERDEREREREREDTVHITLKHLHLPHHFRPSSIHYANVVFAINFS